MTLDEISWIRTIYESGNMSRAAERLFVSQPALSQCLQRVETQLGFRLFERSNKGLLPTEKGKLFYTTSITILDSYKEFLTQAELLDLRSIDTLTIGLAPYISACCSAELLNRLHQEFPDIQFSCWEATTVELTRAIREATIQLAIINEPVKVENMIHHYFGGMQSMVFLRRGSPAATHIYEKDGKQWLDPVFLQDEPIAMTKPGTSSRQLSDVILKECGVKPSRILETRMITTLYNYASKGIASSIAPCIRSVFEEDEKNGLGLICCIPESYRFSTIRYVVHVRPEIDQYLPKSLFDCIAEVVEHSPLYVNRTHPISTHS